MDFHESHRWLEQFYEHGFAVVCPKCSKPAEVHVEQPTTWAPGYWHTDGRAANARLVCSHCGHNALAPGMGKGPWYGAFVLYYSEKCIACGQKGLDSFLVSTHQRSQHCRQCAKPNPFRQILPTLRGGLQDAWFGCTLRFRADVEGHTLWAINRAHAAFLLSYISADQRRRTPNHNASLISRLPAWMKHAKSRRALVKALNGFLNAR